MFLVSLRTWPRSVYVYDVTLGDVSVADLPTEIVLVRSRASYVYAEYWSGWVTVSGWLLAS